jgi:F-type H+-transporting ATPase subunit gamma
MPSLLDIRRRIRAVKSTQQITKAMKMVAASKLRRAQERIMGARPFAIQMQRVLGSLAGRVDASIHPLLSAREPSPAGRTLVIVVTGDKGLCGGFNTSIIKGASAVVLASPQPCSLGLIGRKGRDFFGRRAFTVLFEQVNIFQQLTFADAQAIAKTAMDGFTSEEFDRVVIVYNEFKSVMTQKLVVERLLPIPRLELETGTAAGPTLDYIFEPAPELIFAELLPRHVQVQVYRALLESNAAFYAAQMTAMDAATRNSGEMIESLTLYMNKVRQAAITREIIEVVSGASAT